MGYKKIKRFDLDERYHITWMALIFACDITIHFYGMNFYHLDVSREVYSVYPEIIWC